MRVICTACLRRLYIAPDKVPADSSRFSIVCPQCSTALTVDALQGQTFAEGAAAYAESAVDRMQPSELMELRKAVERMAVKVRAGMRRPPTECGFGCSGACDSDNND